MINIAIYHHLWIITDVHLPSLWLEVRLWRIALKFIVVWTCRQQMAFIYNHFLGFDAAGVEIRLEIDKWSLHIYDFLEWALKSVVKNLFVFVISVEIRGPISVIRIQKWLVSTMFLQKCWFFAHQIICLDL